MGELIEATDADFDAVISEGTVLVDFGATWCGPCRAVEPIIRELAKELDNVKVVKVDVDKASQAAGKHGVSSVPVIMLFKDGVFVDSILGLQKKERILEMLGKQ